MSASSSTISSETVAAAATSTPGREPTPASHRFLAVVVFLLTLTCGLAAAVNVSIDPFGYFGFNQTGLFFNDERAFKLVQVRKFPHEALLMGDSRAAYVDPAPIKLPRFFNAAFGSAHLEEMVWLWDHYTGNAKVLVIGILEGDPGGLAPISEEFAKRSWRDLFRYSLSFELLQRSREAVTRWRAGEPPAYHDNGARIIADKYVRETVHGTPSPLSIARYVSGATPPNKPVVNLCANRPASSPPPDAVPPGYERVGHMAQLAARRGAKLVFFLQPRHQEVIDEARQLGRPYTGPPEILVSYMCSVNVALFDLTDAYTNPDYYWSGDHTHYYPNVGVALIEEVLKASGIAVQTQ